jgi:hypothetical protein
MTQAELDALPETGTIGAVEKEINGKVYTVPVIHDTVGVLWNPTDDEPCAVTDVHGDRWTIGYGRDGVRYKRRSYHG